MRHRVSRQFRMHGFHLGFGWGHAFTNTCSENSVLDQWPWTEPDSLHWEVTQGLVLPHLLTSTRQMWEKLFRIISRLRLIILLVSKPCSCIVRLFDQSDLILISEQFQLDSCIFKTPHCDNQRQLYILYHWQISCHFCFAAADTRRLFLTFVLYFLRSVTGKQVAKLETVVG